MPALKRSYAMPYVSSTARMRANQLVARSMRRRYKRSRTSGGYANPHPAPSTAPINSDTTKSRTFQALVYRPNNIMTNTPAQMDVIERGAGDNQRIGSKWNPTALHLKGWMRGTSAQAAYVNSGYYVVWDKQPNKALPPMNDVFIGLAPSFMYAAASTDDRFVIIGHKEFNVVCPGAGVLGDKSQYIIDDYIKLPPRLICHSTLGTNSGLIGDRQSGALLLYVYSSENLADITRPTLSIAHRIYFQDC